jgi:type VI secretion system protein ImpK
MTPEFSQVVDPVFLYVLDLLEQIEQGRRVDKGQESWEEERIRIRSLIDNAEAKLGRRDDWELAKYALVSWIDEMLIEAPWPGRDWWTENALEVAYYTDRTAYISFYMNAGQAAKLSKRDALEVYYVCVVLGFRGVYRNEDPEELREHGLPPNLQAWADQTALAIRLGLGRPPIIEKPSPSQGAPPLEGKFRLVGASLAAVCLSALAMMLALLLVFRGE